VKALTFLVKSVCTSSTLLLQNKAS